MVLRFKECKSQKELKEIIESSTEAFSDIPCMEWTLESLKEHIKNGWEVIEVLEEDEEYEEIISVLLVKEDNGKLITKNSGVKLDHQGQGHSHEIKDYYEELARKRKLKKLSHICKIDNFRMISLNEGHGYEQTGITWGEEDEFVEWEKNL